MPTDSTDLVRQHSQRAGMRLLTYREVALPIWRIDLRCMFMRRRPLAPVEEFVLRSVDAELTAVADVAGLLGLPLDFVRNVAAELMLGGMLSPLPDRGDGERIQLTSRGRTALNDLGESQPVEETYPAYHDGILRTWSQFEGVRLVRPREAREQDLLEIPAFPSDPPDPGPSDTDEVRSVFKRSQAGVAELDLVKVLGHEGRRETLFLPAIALVFQHVASADIDVAFLIDGRRSPQVDSAFAQAEGKRKLGIIESLRSTDPGRDSLISEEMRAEAAKPEEIQALQQTSEMLRDRISKLEDRRTVEEDAEPIDALIEEETGRLTEIEGSLRAAGVRMIEVYEHPDLLEDALNNSTERLLIISPWVKAGVVNKAFLDRVRNLAEHDVVIFIAYGIGANDSDDPRAHDVRAVKNLRDLAANFDHVTVSHVGNTHSKVLISDERFAITGSFNWLSFRGDPNRPFRDERSFYVSLEDVIDDVWEKCLDHIDEHGDH